MVAMQTFLILLLIAAMLATVVALVRGVITFLQEASAEARGEGPSIGGAQIQPHDAAAHPVPGDRDRHRRAAAGRRGADLNW